tara:strand:+ start:27 stop:530 length:504 start_codon:yes stop_codon:yes gene_type:complete
MWTIIKINSAKAGFFHLDLKKKIGSNYEIYYPKVLIKKNINKKTLKKDYPLLGDYIFCFHDEFKNSQFIKSLKFLRGLKYFLGGHIEAQEEIKAFIAQCKSRENVEGYLPQNFHNLILNSSYQFKSGVFFDKIFKLIKVQKNQIKILINDIKVEVKNKKNFLIFNHN